MIQDNLDKLIANAMKTKNETELQTYRAIKTAFMEYRTSKNAKPLDEAAELNIIRKMLSERIEAGNIYVKAGRDDLSAKEFAEAVVLETQFLPKEPNPKDIEVFALSIITEKDMKKMGGYIKEVKDKFPTASGKTVSDIVRKLITQ